MINKTTNKKMKMQINYEIYECCFFISSVKKTLVSVLKSECLWWCASKSKNSIRDPRSELSERYDSHKLIS